MSVLQGNGLGNEDNAPVLGSLKNETQFHHRYFPETNLQLISTYFKMRPEKEVDQQAT